MATVGDIELLNDYARTKSEAAFATLVDRYLNLVYSAAMRQVRDADLAKDVSQAVFIILARKAGRLGPKTILSGWLYRTACFASRDALKADYRRQRREQEAMKMEQEIYSDQALWEELSPVLDEAMQQLKPKDRDAILLRFFEDQSFREVGAALGSNEDAAQKRVSRALDKLRGFLRNRGVTASLIGLGGALLSDGAHAAPFGLKGVVTVGATAGVAGAGGGATLSRGWQTAFPGAFIGIRPGSISPAQLASPLSPLGPPSWWRRISRATTTRPPLQRFLLKRQSHCWGRSCPLPPFRPLWNRRVKRLQSQFPWNRRRALSQSDPTI
jgi:RNA polymerase sigma factor (sigma-70 family)